MKCPVKYHHGFTLVETVIIIVVLGILAAVATVQFGDVADDARFKATLAEMDAIAKATVGNPDIYSRGARSDFGYVGDVGALPPNLDALYSNPGGYVTWDGPYIKGSLDPMDYKYDAWNAAYGLIGTTIRSTGSGSNIDKVIAPNAAALIGNSITGFIVDANLVAPGDDYKDSVVVRLVYPDGAGGLTTAIATPDKSGRFSFSGLPIGNHGLEAIFIPASDTVRMTLCISPSSSEKVEIIFPADLW